MNYTHIDLLNGLRHLGPEIAKEAAEELERVNEELAAQVAYAERIEGLLKDAIGIFAKEGMPATATLFRECVQRVKAGLPEDVSEIRESADERVDPEWINRAFDEAGWRNTLAREIRMALSVGQVVGGSKVALTRVLAQHDDARAKTASRENTDLPSQHTSEESKR